MFGNDDFLLSLDMTKHETVIKVKKKKNSEKLTDIKACSTGTTVKKKK